MLKYENSAKRAGFGFIIGVDEAGRGPLAGPVVAAAVLLKSRKFRHKITDSKKISHLKRIDAFYEIYDKAFVGVGIISELVIDRINIIQATFLAMHNAVNQLMVQMPNDIKQQKGFYQQVILLIDGNLFKSELPYEYKTIVNGDNLSLSIAAASIIAKVTRDRILENYDKIYPQYGFKQHKGYPTFKHKQAIRQFGPSQIQRKSYQFA